MHRFARPLVVVSPLLLALLAFVTAGGAAAQSSPPNAADDYRRAFALLDRLDPSDRETIANIDWNATTLTRSERAALTRARPVINAFREGTGRSFVDFGIDYTDGPHTLLPHLSPIRQGVRMLLADARMRLIDGDTRGATQNLRSVMKLSDHTTSDPILISTLVGTATYSVVNDSIRQMLGEGALDQAAVKELTQSLDEIVRPDPFGFAQSLQGERDAFAGWMIREYGESGDAAKFIEDMGMFGDDAGDGLLGLGAEIAALNPESFRAAMMSYDDALGQVVEAAKIEDLNLAQSEMKRLMGEIEEGRFGPVAMMFVPSFDRVMESVLLAYGAMADLREDLAEASASEEALADLQNAAAWYRQAIAAMKKEFGPDVARLRELAAAEQADLAEVAPRLVGMNGTREALAKAVAIKRCDFDSMSRWPHDGLRARLSHLEDMRALAAFVALDAQRMIAAPDEEAAGARLAWLAAMADHLGQTPWPASAHTAFDVLGQTLKSTSQAIAAANIPRAALRPAHDMLERITLKDPLHLNDTIANWPRISIDWMLARYRGRNATHQFVTEMTEPAGPLAEELRTALWEETPEVLRRELSDLKSQFSDLLPFAYGRQFERVQQDIEARIARYEERGHASLARFLLDPVAELVALRDQARVHVETLRALTSQE